MTKPKLLVVDDEEFICKQLKWGLSDEYEVVTATNIEEALALFNKTNPDLITLDVNLSPMHREGFKILQEIMAMNSYAKVIMVTGEDDKESAINGLQLGAHDYYLKPIDVQELKIILKRALYLKRLETESDQQPSKAELDGEFLSILGRCKKMRNVINLVKRIAKTDMSVLIRGESGTGKELIAQAIHKCSQRAERIFMPIDCGAIPDNLLESELFGHEKGAFTDAHSKRLGKVEIANKGTLFLDEIAELPLSLQVKLLRFLQERKIQRVGGNEFIPIDIRVISATNRNLEQEIKEGSFREDIYYRLNEITIELPPLRERDEDIIFMANAFLNRYIKEMGLGVKELTSESIEALLAYSWPGNVRELENKIKRALVIAIGKKIKPRDLGIDVKEPKKEPQPVLDDENLTLKELKDRVEKDMLLKSIEKYDGNLSKISKNLGIARSTIYDLMAKYGLSEKKKAGE